MSLRLCLLNTWLRRVEKPRLARIGWQEARARFERQSWLFRPPSGAVFRNERIGGVPVTWASAGPVVGDAAILWLHGGAHMMGSRRTHRAMLARFSSLIGIPACLPEMRRAPEHPYPAALEDAEAVWRGLIREIPAERIVLGGDSSGGGLMLALLARCLARSERPACAVAFSPWTDLTGASPSLAGNVSRDPLLPAGRYGEAVGYYLAGAPADDPGVSPLFAAFPDCPPVHLQVSDTEILRDDSLRLAEKLRAQGTEVSLDRWPDLPHVAAIFQGWLPEADAVLERAAAFVRSQVGSR